MTDEQTSFHDEIVDYATSHGLTPTPEQIEAANALLNTRLIRFSTGLTFIDGGPGDIAPAFDDACQFFPTTSVPMPSATAPVAPPPPAVRDPVNAGPTSHHAPIETPATIAGPNSTRQEIHRTMDIMNAKTLIASAATSNGLRLDAQAIETAAVTLASSVAFDADEGGYVPMEQGVRAFTVVGGQAVDVTLVDHILGLVRQFGGKPPVAVPQAKASPDEPEWVTHAYAGAEAVKRKEADAKLALAQKIAAGPNPWRKEHWNYTNQMILRTHLPQIAAQMQARVYA